MLCRLAGLPPPAPGADAAALAAQAERIVSSHLAAAAGADHAAAGFKRREVALQVQLAKATLENVELRREVAAGWQAAEGNIIRVRSRLGWSFAWRGAGAGRGRVGWDGCQGCGSAPPPRACPLPRRRIAHHRHRFPRLCRQVRQLLLDPAVEREFEHLRQEAADAGAVAQQLRERANAKDFKHVRRRS